MKAAAAFASLIAPDIERYLTLKQALGREYDGVRRVLAHVDLFVSTRGGDLTSDTFAGWCLTLQHLASGTRRSLGRKGMRASRRLHRPSTLKVRGISPRLTSRHLEAV